MLNRFIGLTALVYGVRGAGTSSPSATGKFFYSDVKRIDGEGVFYVDIEIGEGK